MTFSTSIQSFTGTHNTGLHSQQIGLDWSQNNVYIGGIDAGSVPYFTSYGFLSGSEQAFVAASTYNAAIAIGNSEMIFPPRSIQSTGDPILCWFSLNGGGLFRADGTTLAFIGFGGANSLPPYGFQLAGLVNIVSGSAQFQIGTELHGDTYIFNDYTFAGCEQPTLNTGAVSSPGQFGNGIGFVMYTPLNPGDVQQLDLVKFTCIPGGTWNIGMWPTQNANITKTNIGSILPTDVDPAYTHMYCGGMCVDQTDGNLIIVVNGTGGAYPGYIVKVNSTTAAVMWVHGDANGTGGGGQMAFSSIKHQRYGYISGGVSYHVTILDTSTGSVVDTYTAGLGGINAVYEQCYNDTLGVIVLDINISGIGGAGTPTPLNSTPSSFANWAALYVADAITPIITTGSYTRIWGNYHL